MGVAIELAAQLFVCSQSVRIRIVIVPVGHLDSLELYDGGDGRLKAAPFLREAHGARSKGHDGLDHLKFQLTRQLCEGRLYFSGFSPRASRIRVAAQRRSGSEHAHIF